MVQGEVERYKKTLIEIINKNIKFLNLTKDIALF